MNRRQILKLLGLGAGLGVLPLKCTYEYSENYGSLEDTTGIKNILEYSDSRSKTSGLQEALDTLLPGRGAVFIPQTHTQLMKLLDFIDPLRSLELKKALF